ncbi:BB-like protein [Mya arenaria]|uniref:BB-like protein n=1 Tax=Mya arenaria TaxID=6604 RepID=A0ABY7E1C4_MYAAR|nr:BB-like protein [Mya arenaria]
MLRADREEQEQQDRMVALRLQESITQEEMTIRRGQHGRNIGLRGFSHHITGHRSRGMGRSELAMSLHGEEDQRGGGWDERVEALPSMSFYWPNDLQDDHQIQHEWSRPLQDIQQMGTREDFDRILSMLNEPGLSNVGNSYEALLELGENLGTVTSGLSTEECSTLPTARYTQRDKNTAERSVCLEKYKTGDAQKTLPCIHIFHKSCIDEWLKNNATCPVCREVVKVS